MATIKIEIEIDDTDQLVLKDGLKDINAWFQLAATGKINNCWKKMQSEWTTRLMEDSSFTDSIPSNKTDFVTLVTARSDYKDFATKDSESTP